MKILIFIAAPLLLLACSPPAAVAPPPQISAETRAAMDRINNADFSEIASEPAIPEPAVAPQPNQQGSNIPAAATTTVTSQPGPAGDAQPEATVPANVQYNAAMVRIEVL